MDDPWGSVELEVSDELLRLRRRAYGPDADIEGDAAAQARLAELEAGQRRQPTPVDAAPPVLAEITERVLVPEAAEGSVTEHESVDGPIADPDFIDGAAPAPWWRRRLAILGAIAALALIAAHIALMPLLLADRSTPIPSDTSTARMPPIPDALSRPDSAPPPDYVLAVESVGAEADAPNDPHGTLNVLGISADELLRYEEFRDLGVWSGESRHGMTCLLVAVPVQGLREGLGAEGCSPEGLDTVAELVHPASYGFPAGPAFAGLPPGSLIRFVLRDNHVDVYVYVAGDGGGQ